MSIATLKVLAEMLKNPYGQHYGLEIARATKLPSGSLYPILARLEQHGWLTGAWEDIDPVIEGRRPRRYYVFSNTGLKEARDRVTEMASGLSIGLAGSGHV